MALEIFEISEIWSNVNHYPHDELCNILLYGTETLNSIENTKIISATIQLIKKPLLEFNKITHLKTPNLNNDN